MGPFWPDFCGHLDEPGNVFLGTVYYEPRQTAADVYLFRGGRPRPVLWFEVCIRYGRQDSEYVSPGEARACVSRVLSAPDDEYPVYYVTAARLVAHGLSTFTRCENQMEYQ